MTCPNCEQLKDHLDGLVNGLRPFAALGGGIDMPAFHDLPPDIILYENSGEVITVADIRTARALLEVLDDAASA